MMRDIHDQCRNRWASILFLLGVPSAALRNRQGPCPICGGKDRFRFDDKDGRGTWYCNQCGAGNGMDLAMKVTGLSFADCAASIRQRLGEAVERPPTRKVEPEAARSACSALWGGAVPLADSEAEAYLLSREIAGPYSDQLRYHSAAEVPDHPRRRTLPAMLARVSGHDGEGLTLHRTYLENGRKARWTPQGETTEASCRRLMPGGSLRPDAAIRLVPHDGRLGVAEGIETALAVTRDFGIPCWSLINAGHMAKWVVPADVTELHIFGDHDPKFAGHWAAWTLAHRTAVLPRAPKVLAPSIPLLVGTDWADLPCEKEAA